MVSMSASIWVGCHWSVRPFHTGTRRIRPASRPTPGRSPGIRCRRTSAEHPGRVLDRLGAADVASFWPEVGDVRPWSWAPTSNAARVRVEAFSKMRAMLRPVIRCTSVSVCFSRRSVSARSTRKRNSSFVKSTSFRRLRPCRSMEVSTACVPLCRIAHGRAGHTTWATPATPELAARDADHFDAVFAQHGVGATLRS